MSAGDMAVTEDTKTVKYVMAIEEDADEFAKKVEQRYQPVTTDVHGVYRGPGEDWEVSVTASSDTIRRINEDIHLNHI